MPAALRHHGYIQIDPINVCGRMQDHLLRTRVKEYREGDLLRWLHGPGERQAFEHHLPSTGILVVLEPGAWPYLQAEMRARSRRTSAWSGRLSPRERELADKILATIQAEGPMGSESIADERRARHVWGAASLAKATMQKLFFHGRLLIAGRANGRRLYALPERVLPAPILQAPIPTPTEVARWSVHLKLRQRRLVALKRSELPLVDDLVQPIEVEGCPLLHCLKADAHLLDVDEPIADNVRLLAPLDPLIYDRQLTRKLWGFDYTWEVYTPPAKRKRGYYALPVLRGTALVGHVDLKANREIGRLTTVSRHVPRGTSWTPAVCEIAQFLGLKSR